LLLFFVLLWQLVLALSDSDDWLTNIHFDDVDRSTESPSDILCPEKDDHLPSCTRCTESFRIIAELQKKIEHDLEALQHSYADFDAEEEQEEAATTLEADNPAIEADNQQQDWSQLKVSELKEACKKRGIKQTGTKDALVARLDEWTPPSLDAEQGQDDYGEWRNEQLKDECEKRSLSKGGTKKVLLERLRQDDKEAQEYQRNCIKMRKLSTEELLALQRLEELRYDIDCRKSDLVDFRSHLARHLAEETKAKEELVNLADDEAIVTCDYKMKILSCFFRENQKKWFGKRGTSMLGFMIVSNSTDEEQRAKGIKEVNFVMMVTDDGLQDEWEVACAKKVVYTDYLPDHVKKVHFVSDGAGCFKSQFHRAFSPFWKCWTGIDEVSIRITPAGDGKSCLDGMFGRMNVVLKSAVDQGRSYYNSATIMESIESTSGMTATEFVRFEPNRSNRVDVVIEGINLESVLLTLLDHRRESGDQTIVAFKHTGFGNGTKIDLKTQAVYSWRRNNPTKEAKKKKADVIPDIYLTNVSFQFVCRLFYFARYLTLTLPFTQGTINLALLEKMHPSCSLLESSKTAKSKMKSELAKSGEGANHPKVRAVKRKNRIEKRSNQKKDVIEQRREGMEATGLFLCGSTCPVSNRYCRGVFRGEKWYENHVRAGKHNFPLGMNARDRIMRMASKTGGLVEVGSRPDRQRNDVLFEKVKAAFPGSVGEEDAQCLGTFNRKEGVVPYRKPRRLIAVLMLLFDEEPKLRACEMRARMREMRDEDDGGLLFCWSKRNMTGLLLTDDQIQAWINSQTQTRKKKKGGFSKKDLEQARLVQQLENN
jgi:hypothetical protein